MLLKKPQCCVIRREGLTSSCAELMMFNTFEAVGTLIPLAQNDFNTIGPISKLLLINKSMLMKTLARVAGPGQPNRVSGELIKPGSGWTSSVTATYLLKQVLIHALYLPCYSVQQTGSNHLLTGTYI